MPASLLRRRAPHIGRDPDTPNLPVGDSKREVLYVLIAIAVLLLIALSFWFQASR